MTRHRYSPLRALAALAVFAALLPAASLAQTVDNQGRDFITNVQPNFDGAVTIELHLTADVPTTATVQYPVSSPTFNETVALVPGTITIVELPATAATAWTPGSVQNNAVRAFGPEEFVAYTVNRRAASSDAALALPVDALNTEYIVQTYTPLFAAQFIVVAAFDDTDVTITPAAALVGRPAGTPFTITLDRGQGFYGRSASTGSGGDLSGTTISATRPVTMTNGNQCTNVPPGTFACDHVYEVAQPVASWGSAVIAPPLPNRPSGSVYRVLAAVDNTVVSQDGTVVATLDSGEFYDTGIVPGAHVFSSDSEDKPIFVTQYMTGVGAAGAVLGDPAMGNLIPSDQYLSSYTFSTIGGGQFAQNFVSVVAQNTDVAAGTILLDGSPIPASEFTPVAGTAFSYAVVEISDGTHTTQSAGVHGITVEGYDSADSYIYPGGARFEFIFRGEDETDPICSGSLDGDVFFGGATDASSDDPDNTGIFFVTLSEDSENLTLEVDPFVPGAESVSYEVSLTVPGVTGSGSVIVTDGAGNSCVTPVVISQEPVLAECTPSSSLFFSDWDTDATPGPGSPRGEFAEVTNDAGDGTGYDLSGCDFLVFDPFTENVTYAADAAGVVTDGGTYEFANVPTGNGQAIPLNTFPDAPSVFALVDGDAAAGQSVGTVLANADVVAAVVLDRDGTLFGSARGGSGMTASATAAALYEALSRLYAVADEGDGALGLDVTTAPNPASGRTTITFGLAEAGDASVTVYDALGRQVAVVADGAYAAGRHDVTLDASALPTGVYVVRVAGAGTARSAQLTVVR